MNSPSALTLRTPERCRSVATASVTARTVRGRDRTFNPALPICRGSVRPPHCIFGWMGRHSQTRASLESRIEASSMDIWKET